MTNKCNITIFCSILRRVETSTIVPAPDSEAYARYEDIDYYTIWLTPVIPCKKILSFVDNMLTNRRFQIVMRDNKSRWRISNDGLPQGSILAPTLFNCYIHDLPITSSSGVRRIRWWWRVTMSIIKTFIYY